jgi:allantoicase
MDFTQLIDLAAERLGAAVVLTNDEFFAPTENLIRSAPPVWREGEYTERGKWMDGWETRRRREPGHDWCIIRLGRAGVIRGVVIDTSYFTGNYPETCSLDGATIAGVPDATRLSDADIEWREILPRSPLQGNTRNLFAIDTRDERSCTHVRLNIFPDGGVARLRLHGIVTPDWSRVARDGVELDLAAMEHGGYVVSCSDMFYGNRQNLILPGPSLGMHDGWETKRRRGPGHDWAIVRLAARGAVRRAVVDTSHFKGNAPGACTLEACAAGVTDASLQTAAWQELLPRTTLQPHTAHEFLDELKDVGAVTHVRLNIYPDGGVARLRLYGRIAP